MKRVLYSIKQHFKLPSLREGLGVGFEVGLFLFLLTSCISTESVPDGDQLFTGLKKISYDTDTLPSRPSPLAPHHEDDIKAEVEAALATMPNGAIFGSSYYHAPFSWRLWVYNRFSGKESKFAKWMMKSFGKPPVLMSKVNPALRASVAQSVLRSGGYFRGSVTYEHVTQKNPKKGKIAYHVCLDTLFTYDSVAYIGFHEKQKQLIDSTTDGAYIRRGLPFSVNTLEAERSRLSALLRNNGYYYYNSNYTNFLADTVNVRNRVQMRIQPTGDLPDEAQRQWYIGNIDINLRRSYADKLTDSLQRGHLNIHFSGEKSPIRPRVLLKDMRLFPRRLFSYEKYQETAANINATGVFSSVDFQFTPRDADTLDLRLNCTFDKPYDFYFETNLNARTIGRYGPEVKVGFTKRNAFHGGENLDVNLHGNYEWQKNSGGGNMNTYQYGVDASIEFPRLIAPFYDSYRRRLSKDGRARPRRHFSTPTTLAKLSFDIVNRPDYYRMHIAAGEWTYRWQPTEQSRHEFSPLTLKYQRINSSTEAFIAIMAQNVFQATAMEDQFIPKMRYTYTYTSPTEQRHPIRWETTVAEAGNGMALYDVLLQGHNWSTTGKTFFRNPYAQFVRLETDFTKTWQTSATAQLVGHVNAGIMRCYGNTEIDDAPFSELFYVGGANSIRAFNVRGIGPGSFNGTKDGIVGNQRQFNYVVQNGDIKFVANLEYRTRLFGNLGGAIFLDAGNVWRWNDPVFTLDDLKEMVSEEEYSHYDDATKQKIIDYMNDWFSGWAPRSSTIFDQIALGTGVGLRYDLGFLVIRIDWGLALHMPYKTNRSGYFNVDSFRDAQTLHFAVGYPF